MTAEAVEHFLISIALAPDARMHAYVVTDDKRYLYAAADRLLTEAEKLAGYPLTGLMVATPIITADVAVVREIVCKRSAEAEHLLATASDFYWAFFATHADDPADAQLMAMH